MIRVILSHLYSKFSVNYFVLIQELINWELKIRIWNFPSEKRRHRSHI